MTRPRPSTRRCGTWSPIAPGGAPMARWPCWPTSAPGAGCSIPSASTSAPTAGPTVGRNRSAGWWPRWRTRHGTSAMPMWSGPRGGTASPRSSTCHRFYPRNLDYELRYTAPGPLLTVGPRRARGRPSPLRRHPPPPASGPRPRRPRPPPLEATRPLTHRVTGAIYAQAARLWLKGAPFFGHPERGGKRPATLATGSCPVGPTVRRTGAMTRALGLVEGGRSVPDGTVALPSPWMGPV